MGVASTRWMVGWVSDLRCGCFLAAMYAKMKEVGPVRVGAVPLDPPLGIHFVVWAITMLIPRLEVF